jgi:hypothetical protein
MKPWEKYAAKDAAQVSESSETTPWGKRQVATQPPTPPPAQQSLMQSVKSFVTGEGQREQGVPEYPYRAPQLHHAKDPQQAADLMQLPRGGYPNDYVPMEGSEYEQGVKGIKFSRNDNYGNPLYVSDKPISPRISGGQEFYRNAPGASMQDMYEVASVIPESVATLTGGWKKGIVSAAMAAFANKAAGTIKADILTNDFRSMPKRLGEATQEAAYGAVGEGAGRVASHVLSETIPTAFTKIWRKFTNAPAPSRWVDASGDLTEEALEGLESAGIPKEDISDELIQQLQKTSDMYASGQQAAIEAESRLAGQDIVRASELTPGDTTLEAAERALIREVPSSGGETMRTAIRLQSAANEQELRRIANIPQGRRSLSESRTEAAGNVMKHLQIKESGEAFDANVLYETAKALPQDVEFDARHNVNALFDELERDYGHPRPDIINGIRSVLAEYGYLGTPDEAVTHELTIDSAVGMAQRLNTIGSKLSDDTAKGLYQRVSGAVNDDLASIRLPESQSLFGPGTSDNIAKVDAFDKARQNWRVYSNDWRTSKLIGDLIHRTDGVTPKISKSDAYKKISHAKPEEMKFITSKLQKSGWEGQDALKEMRATVGLNLLEDSLDTSARGIGTPIINSDAFVRNLSSYPDGTLEELFTPKQMQDLRRLERVIKRQKTGAITGVKSEAEQEQQLQRGIRSLLGSVWLFRHSPFIGGAVATGKVGLDTASQFKRSKAAKALVSGVEVAKSKQYQSALTKEKASIAKDLFKERDAYHKYMATHVADQYPKLARLYRKDQPSIAKPDAQYIRELGLFAFPKAAQVTTKETGRGALQE